jgi:hypothetical protein
MARRRAVCPRCGQPVGIPSLEPTHAGTAAAPLTPAERLRLAGRNGTASPAEVAAQRDRLGTAILAMLSGRRASGRQRHRPMETRWYQYLLYPFHDWRLWVGPALLLTVLSIAVLLLTPRLLPRLLGEEPIDPAARWALRLYAVLGLFVVGFPCNFLGCVLRSAARGDGSAERWAGHTFAAAWTAFAVWPGCFLAGPVVPAALALAYWMQCGDPGPVDWLILIELLVLTVGYALLVLAAVSESGRLRDVNPLHVIDLAHRLGFRAAVVAVLGSVLVLAHGACGVVAAAELHRNAPVGALLLAACSFSGMICATFLFRLLGVWCHRSRTA